MRPLKLNMFTYPQNKNELLYMGREPRKDRLKCRGRQTILSHMREMNSLNKMDIQDIPDLITLNLNDITPRCMICFGEKDEITGISAKDSMMCSKCDKKATRMLTCFEDDYGNCEHEPDTEYSSSD